MEHFIPFIFGKRDFKFLANFYPDCDFIRVDLTNIATIKQHVNQYKIWLDPGVDIYHDWKYKDEKSQKPYLKHDNQSLLNEEGIQNQPTIKKLEEFKRTNFTANILNNCLMYDPDWISIPQLPESANMNRSKINNYMAESTYQWRKSSEFKGKMILPLIITGQSLINDSNVRRRILNGAIKRYNKSNADGIWIVDSSLNDLRGSRNYGDKIFPKLIKMHCDIKEKLPIGSKIICGPYWALNLILWTRNISTHVAMGIGQSYQYHTTGFPKKQIKAKNSIVIPPLKRILESHESLEHWLKDSRRYLHLSPEVVMQFNLLLNKFEVYQKNKDECRKQKAKFYSEWINRLINIPQSGRSLSLFQDFSKAFSIGQQIKLKLEWEKAGKNPGSVAEQFMRHCL